MIDFLKNILSAKVIVSIIIAAVALIILIVVIRFEKKLKHKKNWAAAKGVTFSIIRLILMVIAILWILQVNGIDVTTVTAGLGIASAIIGLALQDYLQDLIMGIRLLSESFFNVGDCVVYSSEECEVIGFNLQSTKLKNLDDGSVITVCNRNITEIKALGEIINLDIPLSYKEDTRTIHTFLREAADEIGKLDGIVSCEYKGTQSFEDSSILYRLDVRCSPRIRPDVRRQVLTKVQTLLDAAGISIPFNQLDVHCDILK